VPRLRRSNCASAGITRRRRGRGFEYLDPAGARVERGEVRRRIAELAIPPAWEDVWICLDPLGHLQATGVDAAGRKQYLYHERWRAHRDRQKFEAMVAFAQTLPRLRRETARSLRAMGSTRRRLGAAELHRELVLACAVRLLDLGFFRIGSEDYAERNGSYGLTTMRRAHVSIRGEALVFDFPAKSGRRRVQTIRDRDALTVIAALKRRRAGEQLLAYRAAHGWIEVDAAEVNDFIRDHTGGDFSAKDFRTWNATMLAATALGSAVLSCAADAPSARVVRDAIAQVAELLGNTPAICRSSYVDPRVIDLYYAGATVAPALERTGGAGPDLARTRVRTRVERAVLELLDEGGPARRAG
jgi:DNA topoisomerase I